MQQKKKSIQSLFRLLNMTDYTPALQNPVKTELRALLSNS